MGEKVSVFKFQVSGLSFRCGIIVIYGIEFLMV